MLRYASVGGERQLPFPKGRATCDCCGGLLIAKCGSIVTHHWAHESKDDCDSWSEPIGPWHLWWQNLVRPDFIEVTKGPHRADIVGNEGVVVELQHSSISAEDIAAREAFYDNMVWMFDATKRFGYVNQGQRAFFSFGQTKHIELCKKPVFLDFGFDVVQVEQFTEAVEMVSGFGIVRSREWFADAFLSEVRQSGRVGDSYLPEGGGSNPWDKKSPVWKLKHDTKWVDPTTGKEVTFPKWTPYIKLNYAHWKVGDSQNKWFDYDLVIDRHLEIANGWSKSDLRQMKDFLFGTAIILGGLLRILPLPAVSIPVERSVRSTEMLLEIADGHIKAGRLPILKDSTKQSLLEKARQHENRQYGRPQPNPRTEQAPPQPSLFD